MAMMGAGSFAGLAALGASEKVGDEGQSPMALPGVPLMEGTFTVRTTGGMRILANNTDEGPVMEAGGETLMWRISPRTVQVPTALIDVAP